MASPKRLKTEEAGSPNSQQPKEEEAKDPTPSAAGDAFPMPPGDETFRPCIRSGVFAGIGDRPSMEDAHVVMDDAGELVNLISLPTSFYAVFDGHMGKHAAVFCRDHLLSNFLDFMNKGIKWVPLALLCAFEQTDTQFRDACLASGTTALAAVIAGSEVYVANAGDCRAVICRNGQALDMSVDHDPRENMDEYHRITRAGGFLEEGYLNGIINMSRGIGNWNHEGLKGEQGPFISTPEIKSERLTEKDEFMIVASDGLFKSYTSQKAVDFVRAGLEKHNDLDKCARDLAQDAWCCTADSNCLTDNSTIVIVSFRKEVAPLA